MPTRTISLRIEAYDRLRAARRSPEESFSQVVVRAQWPERTITGAELLQRLREHGPMLSEDQLAAIEAASVTHG
jgi:predicted CopG family antitoxin